MFGPVTTAMRPAFAPDRSHSFATKRRRSCAAARFDDGMPPALDLEGERSVDLGPRPVALARKLGERRRDVERAKRIGGRRVLMARACACTRADSSSKIAQLSLASARSAAEAISLPARPARCREAHRIGHGLPMNEMRVKGGFRSFSPCACGTSMK